jgi:hypothetical protein
MRHLSNRLEPNRLAGPLRRGRIAQLAVAAALVTAGTGAVAMDAGGSGPGSPGDEHDAAVVHTVSVTPADRVELHTVDGELAEALADALQVRQQLVAHEPAPEVTAPNDGSSEGSGATDATSSGPDAATSTSTASTSDASSTSAASSSAEGSDDGSSSTGSSSASSEAAAAFDTSGPVSIATWERVAQCESHGNWQHVSRNGLYYGGLQFAPSSWEWVGGTGMPHEASREEQIARAQELYKRQGWMAWPTCSKQLGLR